MHRRAFAAIEQAELNAGLVDGLAHCAAEGIDFANDVTLRHAADGRVAAHLADRVEIRCEQRCARTHTRCGERGFCSGVASANYKHVVVIGNCSGHPAILFAGATEAEPGALALTLVDAAQQP
jgi:hypothetical protein